MSAELISILALVAMFVVATVLPVNLGALAFVGAFLVGTLAAGMSTDDILGAFPGNLFVILVGITYLFAIATRNGTVDWLVRAAVRAVRGRLGAIPLVMFVISALLTAIGAPAPAVAAILAPIAFGFAAEYRMHALMIGLMVAHGTQAGAFSPISVLGGIVNQVVLDAGLPKNDIVLFLAGFFFNTAAAVIVFLIFGGLRLLRRGSVAPPAAAPAPAGAPAGPAGTAPGTATATATATEARTGADLTTSLRPTPHQALTLAGLVALCVAVLVFQLDVGLTAITVAVLLSLTARGSQKGIVEKIAWSTVLLVGGVVTYVGVLQEIGTIDYVGGAVAGIGAPLVAALLICYVGGVVSAFASSVGILGALIPLAVPFLLQGELGAVGLIAALSVSSTIVDVSPFSTTGALLVANARGMETAVFYRGLLVYGAVVVAVGPALTWLVLVAPGWLG
ncbi:SLC13 family permease [Microtetraspora sp. NBRC 13810]|uniref:SLC13 family permease n=1 Tax=Microtetraspora sp. NBRC 13810 TaxID=3030990 RepID=UPI0025555F12|nr:SLC13 family permease [Microtetraspora sp. NBRC 13810]